MSLAQLNPNASPVMGKSKLKGKDLRRINYKSDRAKSMAIDIMSKHAKHLSKAEKLNILSDVLSNPDDYLQHEYLAALADELSDTPKIKPVGEVNQLRDQVKSYKVYGRKFIDQNTIHQMDVAMRLPVAHSGALMPDAHVGYGLPVGGVLATENAVIPYAVGVDIGCRMSLSLFEAKEDFIKRNSYQLKLALKEQTHFGVGKLQDTIEDHEVLDRGEFKMNEVLRQLHGKACKQIGTSGSGNHFVEFGTVTLNNENQLGVPAGNYVGLLAHSGSRGFGAAVANYYTRLAIDLCKLPKGAQHLAWFNLDTEEGHEYWTAMNLAGDYAKACHDVIHRKVARAVGLKPIAKVENHHNFAWKEKHGDEELIVHRKGATPAQANQLGIIPATMVDPGYIVSGKGQLDALFSASHGAGRMLSRSKARQSFTRSAMNKMLKQHGITLLGGGVDEAPWAYKSLEEVMNNQKELVNVEGVFHPKIVRMDKN